MSIEKLIQREVATLPPDATCAEAAQRMRDENIGSVVVADGGRPLGVVTDRDLTVRVIAAGEDPGKLLLRDVMSGEPIFVSRDAGLDQAVAAMRDLAIRRVPVVDDVGQVCGLVAMDDLLVLLSEQLADLAAAIREERAGSR